MKVKKATLIDLRNKKLIKRYYYWYHIERKRMDDVLEILSTDEFFLDTAYILRLIRENNDLVKEIKKAQPKAAGLTAFKFTGGS